MILTKAGVHDIDELHQLEQTLFEIANFPLSKSSFRYHVKNNLVYIARIDQELVGYILVLIKRKNAKIYSLGIKQEHRGKQIAKNLLQKTLSELHKLGFHKTLLEVRSDNIQAISLYKSFTFTVTKQLQAFYLDGCDAYLMEKDNGV